MPRKLWIPALALGLAAVSTGALADHDRGGYAYGDEDRYANHDYARVVGVLPLRRRVRVSEPVREHWDEVEYGPDERAVRGTVGAIIGGAVGNSVSKQRMRERHGDQEYVYERCDVRYRDRYEERIEGYEVTYEYAGRRYVTEMPYDPGDRIRIRVDVTPTEG